MDVPGGDYSNQAHAAAERRDVVVQLRDEGLTFREIGERLGINRQRAHELHKRALRDRPILAASAQRDHERKNAQLAQIDEQRREAEASREAVLEVLYRDGRVVITQSGKVIEGVQDDPTLLAAVDRLVRLDELLLKLNDHEAKLLGLYAKAELNVSGGVTDEILGIPTEDLK